MSDFTKDELLEKIELARQELRAFVAEKPDMQPRVVMMVAEVSGLLFRYERLLKADLSGAFFSSGFAYLVRNGTRWRITRCRQCGDVTEWCVGNA
jgi:hypothetical protein